MAGDNPLVWDALACAAAVRGDRRVLELVALCRPTAQRQGAWSRERLRSRAALALTGRPQPWRRQEAVRLALSRTPVPGDCADLPEPDLPGAGGRA